MTPWLFRPHIMTYWCWFLIANYVSIEVRFSKESARASIDRICYPRFTAATSFRGPLTTGFLYTVGLLNTICTT